MGSGCNNGCRTLFKNSTPRGQVQYTGDPIPALGICTGDYYDEVTSVVLQKLIDYSTGIGISIPDIDLSTCQAFSDCLSCCGTCTDLPCLLECYKNTICTIWTDVEELKSDVETLLNGPYNTACLQASLPANPTLNQIIQELISQFCALYTQVQSISASLTSLSSGLDTRIGNFLGSALGSCQGSTVLNKTGTGSSTTFSLRGFVPIGTIIMAGSNLNLANFDGTGLGRAGTDGCGWAICNGNNGTDNMSGLFPVGTGMGPAVITGMTFPFNTTGGQYAVTLDNSQVPATPVSVSGSHSHDITAVSDAKSTTNISNNIWVIDCTTSAPGTTAPDSSSPPYNIPHTFSGKISTYTGTFTGSVSGGGGAHSNTPPYRALYFLQRVS